MAKRYATRPSKIAGIKDEILAFQFDAAIMLRGVTFESEQYKAASGKAGGGRGKSYDGVEDMWASWKDNGVVVDEVPFNLN